MNWSMAGFGSRFLVTGLDGIHQAVFNMVFQNDLAGLGEAERTAASWMTPGEQSSPRSTMFFTACKCPMALAKRLSTSLVWVCSCR